MILLFEFLILTENFEYLFTLAKEVLTQFGLEEMFMSILE